MASGFVDDRGIAAEMSTTPGQSSRDGDRHPDLHELSPLPDASPNEIRDDEVTSILSEAKKNAQSQLRSTSEVLELVAHRCQVTSPATPTCYQKSESRPVNASGAAALSLGVPSFEASPHNMHFSPSSPDGVHLPGKFGRLSMDESEKLLTNPSLLSQLDGLDKVEFHYSSVGSDERTSAPRRKLDLSHAMEKVHNEASRIKDLNKSLGEPSIERMLSPRETSCSDGAVLEQSMSARMRASPTKGLKSDRLPSWFDRKVKAEGRRREDEQPKDIYGQYMLQESESIVYHELNRGNWTWQVTWSPSGKHLAMATALHGLAVAEVSSQRITIIHDQRMDSNDSIRSIAWGSNFIAIGGTSNSVKIVEPLLSSSQPEFRQVGTIVNAGWVGSMSWQNNTNILAIGNRDDHCLIAEVRRVDDSTVTSKVLHTIERRDWVNAVKFSNGGTKLAIGDRSGSLSIYLFVHLRLGEAPAISVLQEIQLDDSVLELAWSSDSNYLYAGGEDFSLSIIETSKYTVLQKVGRDFWVNCIAPANSHVAVGGDKTISFLDTGVRWKDITSLPCDGVVLSATWHPENKYLATCGQFNSVVIYDTTGTLSPQGKCLKCKTPILTVEFSQDSKMIAIGTALGLFTVFEILSDSFAVVYESVVGVGGNSMSIRWSTNGRYIAVISGCSFMLLDSIYTGKSGPGVYPPNSARFFVRKVVQCGVHFRAVSFSQNNSFIALTDDQTRILNINLDCQCDRILEELDVVDSAWSRDGSVFALGSTAELSIYDVKSSRPDKWRHLFSTSFDLTISSLAWGPSLSPSIQYLGFGGSSLIVLEIKPAERIWETVLSLPCRSFTNDLDWHDDGILAFGDDDGTASVVDLAYLKSGRTVSEFSYSWQRQGIVSILQFERNREHNAITSVRLARAKEKLSLAIGGSDGVVEIIDL